jgi:hypothetical protein
VVASTWLRTSGRSADLRDAVHDDPDREVDISPPSVFMRRAR